MQITLKIERFNPETDAAPHVEEFVVPVTPTDRILDALMYVKEHVDGTLAVRRSCAHGVCGSDAMRINGVERLACKTIVKDVAADGGTVTVEPLRSMKVQRDLMVDQDEFFAKYRIVSPFLIAKEEPPSIGEFVQSPQDRARIDDATKCILCSSCYSACPVVAEKNPRFIGPAAVVQAARFAFDSRDRGVEPRLDAIDKQDGAWACENKFNCTKVCPRGIKVTKSINETKRAITAFKQAPHETA